MGAPHAAVTETMHGESALSPEIVLTGAVPLTTEETATAPVPHYVAE